MVSPLPRLGRTLVMGVLNVTPDSFSDGGRFVGGSGRGVPDGGWRVDTAAAVAQGLALVAEGADLVDVGGESTRPGAERPGVDEERRRVLPVVAALAAHGVAVSVDTMRAEVAVAAVEAGAVLVNDVSGGLAEEDMTAAVAATGAGYVCMHWRGHSTVMQQRTEYVDVVADVVAELGERLQRARAAGIAADRLVADVGFGFAKTGEHSWQLLQRLEELAVLGVPLLVGVSRKAFLGRLLAAPDGTPRPPTGRDDATTALTTVLALHGVWGVRVHAVRPSRDAVAVAARLRAAG